MALFTKGASGHRGQAPAPDSVSVIAADMRVVGDIETSGILRIDGALEGSVRQAHQLFLGTTGTITGDVHAAGAVLAGRVQGTVVTRERLEIQGTATLDGDVHTTSLVVAEGAQLNGTVRMGDAPAPTILDADASR